MRVILPITILFILTAMPLHAAEVISLSPSQPASVDVIHLKIDSFPDCQQQAMRPQRNGNVFVIQIVFDPSITNCNIAALHFAFDTGPLDPGAYVVRTVRVSNGVAGFVTDLPFTVSALVPAVSSFGILSLILALGVFGGLAVLRRHER
jgi:hypothetical protein